MVLRLAKPLPLLLTLACVASLVAISNAQDLIGKLNSRLSENPDPLTLLEQSAAGVESAPAAFNLVNSIQIVAGEQENKSQQVFAVKLGQGGKYSVENIKPSNDFWVRCDGERTMTYVRPLEQYSVSSDADGIGGFAGSRLAGMLGNGFGSLVFSLFDSAATAKVIETTTESSYVAEEEHGELAEHHCRYTSGGMTWDAWFTTGENPRLKRVKPDLSEIAAKAPAARQFDNFSFEMNFEIKDFDAKSEIPAGAFALNAPEGAEEVEDALSPPEPPPHQLLGQEAPLFDALDPAGQPIDLGGLIGKKVVILDFWATWCGPCVAAMPKIDKVADDYADKGVVLYAVNQGEDAKTVTEFLKDKNLDVPVAMDSEGQAAQQYFIEGLPTSVIIGKDGRVQVVHVGFSQNLEASLREELDALLAGKDLAGETIAAWNKKHPKRPVGETE